MNKMNRITKISIVFLLMISICFSIIACGDTTYEEENVTVLANVYNDAAIRSYSYVYGPYTIYNSTPNQGELEFLVEDKDVYYISLFLVDSNSELEDSDQLEVPIGISKFTDSYADYGVDTDLDEKYDYLATDVGINVTESGNYTLSGSLYDSEGNNIQVTTNFTYLFEGLTTIQLKFDGKTIYKSKKDGPYSLRYLTLYRGSEGETYLGRRNRPYNTSAYNYTQFQYPIIMFENFTNFGIDTDSNGLYEYLRINATVDNTVAGNYTITGYLYNENKSFAAATANNPYLNTGLQTVQLDFNGTMISYHGVNGPYNLTINAYTNTTCVNSRENAYLTNVYSSSEFETSLVSLYQYIDLDTPLELLLDQTYNITARITNPSGRVLENLQASINLPSELNTTDPLIVNLGDFQPFETKEVEWTMEAITPGYGSVIFNITSLDIQNISITRDIIVHHFLLSVDTDKDFYKPGDTVIININTTNGNPEVSYLNLSMNITIQGENLSENYSQPVLYIGGLETKNITFAWDATGKASGVYTVTARIFEGATLLNETLTSFEIDGIAPELIDNTPSDANTGDPFKFNATVTDNVQVSTVWIEYWYDAGSHTNVSMTYVADSYWEKTIVIDDTLDTMHYIIAANDTSNNWNNTGIKDVTIYDNDNPEITNVQAIPSEQAIGGYVNISAVVTDNIEVDEVFLYIEYPDNIIENVLIKGSNCESFTTKRNTVENFSITQNRTGDTYYCNKTYQQPGTYTYHIWANDTSGNNNVSADYTFEIMNQPPDAPSDPSPSDGATGVDIDTDLSWNCSDPDGHSLTYDVYFEADDPTPDVLVSDDQSETTYDPGTLEYETTYYWQIIAKDEYGATTEGPIWQFTTEEAPEPDLDCEGSLSWTNVEPGSTVTGSFTVKNIGDPGSELDWEIIEWPEWGDWSFDPDSGTGLPDGSSETVDVEVAAPDDPNTEFTGEVKVINSDDPSDYCTIPVYLKTPVNQPSTNQQILKTILRQFLSFKQIN